MRLHVHKSWILRTNSEKFKKSQNLIGWTNSWSHTAVTPTTINSLVSFAHFSRDKFPSGLLNEGYFDLSNLYRIDLPWFFKFFGFKFLIIFGIIERGDVRVERSAGYGPYGMPWLRNHQNNLKTILSRQPFCCNNRIIFSERLSNNSLRKDNSV